MSTWLQAGLVLSPARRQLSSALRSSAGLSAWFPVQFAGDTQHPGPEVGSGGERWKLKKQLRAGADGTIVTQRKSVSELGLTSLSIGPAAQVPEGGDILFVL